MAFGRASNRQAPRLPIPGSATGIVTNTTHPVVNGPFGTVSTISYPSFPAWFATIGPNAVPIATLQANGNVSLAAINRNTLNAGSGGVVLFSDINLFNNAFTGSTPILVDNATAFAIPEPSSTGMVLTGSRGRVTSCRFNNGQNAAAPTISSTASKRVIDMEDGAD